MKDDLEAAQSGSTVVQVEPLHYSRGHWEKIVVYLIVSLLIVRVTVSLIVIAILKGMFFKHIWVKWA